MEYEIAYHERGHVVGDVGSFMSVPNPSTSSDDLGVDPYTDATGLSSSWGGDVGPSTRAPITS